MFNTIILKKGYEILTDKEHGNFETGGTIWGENAYSEELNRWPIECKEEAQRILAGYRSSYEYDKGQNRWYIEEYALEFCETDDDGEFVEGSDYELARLA